MNVGVKQSWDQPSDTGAAREVDIQHRVILSPFAAKRLSDELSQLVRDYEQRYGHLGRGAERRGVRRVRCHAIPQSCGVRRGADWGDACEGGDDERRWGEDSVGKGRSRCWSL